MSTAVQITKAEADNADDLSIKPGVTLDLRVSYKLLVIQRRCIDKRLEFNLTFKRLKQLMQQQTCYYTGTTFVENDQFMGRSIDRVDSDKGYTDDNVVACTTLINMRKSDLSLKQLKALISGMVRFDKRIKAKNKNKEVARKRIMQVVQPS